MNKRTWAYLAIWFICFMAVENFLRFRFGLVQIGWVFLVIAVVVALVFGKWFGKKDKKP